MAEGTAGQAVDKHLWHPLRAALRILTALGRHLLESREANGALTLVQGKGSELKFKLDPGKLSQFGFVCEVMCSISEGTPIEVHGKEEMEVFSSADHISHTTLYTNSCSLRYTTL